ncbi:MAG: hypothetical protein AB8F94_26465 [Saprospiraceae bacterium]
MKQLTLLSKFFILALALSFWTSCDPDDGTGGGFVLGPTVELKSGADLTSSDATVTPGQVFKVNVSVSKGDNDMSTFTVLEDGIAIDASRLNYNGGGSLSNPYSLTSAETDFFDTNIEITAQTSGSVSYTFRMSDSAGESDETTITISVASTPLILGFEAANGGLAADATLAGQSNFKVELVASKGGSPLNTLTVLEDGTEVDAARIKFGTDNDFALASDFFSNPLDLVNDEKDGFDWFVWVNSHDAGTRTYTFRVTDETGASEDLTLDISIAVGTPVAELSAKLLKNSGGAAGQGGINLLTGDETGSAVADGGHLKDNGIDLALPVSQNWKKTVSPVGNNLLRTPGIDFPVDDFAAVQFSEEIQVAFENGDDVTTSNVVAVGDRFLMQLITGEYVLVLVTNIDETTNNNNDFYELSIKY